MRQHEVVLVFGRGKLLYNAQMVKRDKAIKSGGTKNSPTAPIANKDVAFKKTYEFKNPTTLLTFDKIRRGSVHPTQKPVPLFEYLIKTYTNEGETVLDNCVGSGTTAIAAINTNRQYIGIEMDAGYVEIARNRIKEAQEVLV